MEWVSLIPAKPKESGGGDLNVEHGSWSDGDRKEAEGVTPLWTVFHLCNYFWRYFVNFGIFENFEAKKPKLVEEINAGAQNRNAIDQERLGWHGHT